jgi:outer membrane biogenesis lipoprotein LolB
MADMRCLLALFIFACLSACGLQQSQSEHALVRYDDEWRQKQAELDAAAILQGMAQARQSREQMARSAR